MPAGLRCQQAIAPAEQANAALEICKPQVKMQGGACFKACQLGVTSLVWEFSLAPLGNIPSSLHPDYVI